MMLQTRCWQSWAMPLAMPLVTGVSLLGLGPSAALAGTAIGESIWDKANAIARAKQAVPAGAVVTDTRCQSIEVGLGNYRYICTLTFTSPAPVTPIPSRSGPASAPAP